MPELDPSPRRYGDMRRAIKSRYDALVIGVRDPVADSDRLNPPDDLEVSPELLLIYLAREPSLPPAD